MHTHLFVVRRAAKGRPQVTLFALFVPPAVCFSTAAFRPWCLRPFLQVKETIDRKNKTQKQNPIPAENLN